MAKSKAEKYRAKALECEALAQAARDPFIQWVCHLGSSSARLGLSQKGGLPRSGERYSHLVQGRQRAQQFMQSEPFCTARWPQIS